MYFLLLKHGGLIQFHHAIRNEEMENYIENKVFEKINYSEKELPKGEYDNCSFVDCTFSNSDLSNIPFIECKFNNCDFSMAKVKGTALKDVKFIRCKLLGLNFNDCNDFLLSVEFEDSLLNFASFYKLKLKNTKFKNCNLQETDFTETDLTRSVFDNCDLSRAIFEHTVLEKVDFRTAHNYSIDPEENRLKKAKFSRTGVIGLLNKYDIDID